MRNSLDIKTDHSGSGLGRRSRSFLTLLSGGGSLRFEAESKQKFVYSDQNPVRNSYLTPRTWFIDSIRVKLAFWIWTQACRNGQTKKSRNHTLTFWERIRQIVSSKWLEKGIF